MAEASDVWNIGRLVQLIADSAIPDGLTVMISLTIGGDDLFVCGLWPGASFPEVRRICLCNDCYAACDWQKTVDKIIAEFIELSGLNASAPIVFNVSAPSDVASN